MAKFRGKVGFITTEETRPGIWDALVTERFYYCDLIRNFRRSESSGNLNDDINISNKISIVADPYANDNIHSIKYVEFMGTKWKVSNVEVQYPRLILDLGGLYNGEQA
jgi:hypothetical protein